MQKVKITISNKSVLVDQIVWSAFLQAASLTVDSGDMYPHLEKNLGTDILDQVKDLKIELDDQNHFSSSRRPENIPALPIPAPNP
jgi:hypothetical protein